MTPLLPDNAPFTPDQRAWLSGFFAALIGTDTLPAGMPATVPLPPQATGRAPAPIAAMPPPDEAVEVTWHDPTLALGTRMERAAGLALPHRLHAAMGQQDCGQCGYLCRSYARALFDGSESDTSLCTPGGRDTRRKLKELLSERAAPAGGATGPQAAPSHAKPAGATPIPAPRPGSSRQHPLRARVLESRPLHGPDAERDTRHVVLRLPDEAPEYRPGDALGVLPCNAPALVDRLLTTLGLSPDTPIEWAAEHHRASDLLANRLDITRPSDECLALLCEAAGDATERARLAAWLESGPEEGLDLLDLLLSCPGARPPPGPLFASLGQLQPRLYSIASCPRARPGCVELTVSVVRYTLAERARQGVASGCLADARPGETELLVYLQPTAHFHPPADPATPIVMVGPGTGIAPFRAFLQARARLPAEQRGPAWLFFGNPRAATDFIYRDELEAWLADGTLTRLSTAFSRDQAHKVYVQQRMLEEGAALWEWLGLQGAHFYVCGDARRMAPDVEAALLTIARLEGGLDEPSAVAWLDQLNSSGRFRRDVY